MFNLSNAAHSPRRSNDYGLASRSPFSASTAAAAAAAAANPRSPSVASAGTRSYHHPLFPFASTSKALPASRSAFDLSHHQPIHSPAAVNKRTFDQRAVSPPPPPLRSVTSPAPTSASDDVFSTAATGPERARKRQMIWDPQRGLISREEKEREDLLYGHSLVFFFDPVADMSVTEKREPAAEERGREDTPSTRRHDRVQSALLKGQLDFQDASSAS